MKIVEESHESSRQEPLLADIAYAKIKDAIVQGELSPGHQVAEQQIAARLEISRTPVHQAIVRLEQEGWVRLLHRKGFIVSALSAPEMRDVYEVLMSLESVAVQRLAEEPNKAVISKLASITRSGGAALKKGDLDEWARADDAFHTLLTDECGNQELARMSRTVREKAHRARLLTLGLRPEPMASNHDHESILAAIKAGDVAKARSELEAHRKRGMHTLLPIIERLSTRPRILSA